MHELSKIQARFLQDLATIIQELFKNHATIIQESRNSHAILISELCKMSGDVVKVLSFVHQVDFRN